jgi:hypothetical protein
MTENETGMTRFEWRMTEAKKFRMYIRGFCGFGHLV